MTLETRNKKRPRNWRSARSRRRFNQAVNDYRMIEKMFYYYKKLKREVDDIR